MADLIASGTDIDELETALNSLPSGSYDIEVYMDDGSAYEVNVDSNPDADTGVGIAPLLLAGLGIIGALVGWKIFSAFSAIPDWVWLIGGIALAVMLINPIMDIAFPKKRLLEAGRGLYS